MGGLEQLGPYELQGELGSGAMARVWRAWDPNLQREVAIKEPLFDQRLSDAQFEEIGKRFVAEGRTAARLSHPGIVTIHAADVWDGRPAIVMELVRGETLAQRLKRGPLFPSDAVAVADQLLDAVGYAHTRGVIHRDIKPDNIFVTDDGRIKLADFGIAHATNSDATIGTVAGTVLGTPGYMSPEQANGAHVDERSDLFSVGVVLYEMLMGYNPFTNGERVDSTTLIYRIVHVPAPDLPPEATKGLPVDIRPVVMRALSKNPADRPQSADEFRAMLRRGADVQPISIVEPPVRRSWIPYAAVGAVAVALLGFLLMNASNGSKGGWVTQPPVTTSDSQESSEKQDVSNGADMIETDNGESNVDEVDTSDEDVSTNDDVTEPELQDDTEDVAQQPIESNAERLPREWRGTIDGASKNGSVMSKPIEIVLTSVAESGRLSGICSVLYDSAHPEEGTGSYYVDGFVDWTAGKIELYGTSWANKGGLANMRRFMGTLSPEFDSIEGSCELLGGGHLGAWSMTAV